MKRIDKTGRIPGTLALSIMAVIMVLLFVPLTLAHGPKGHTDGFTPLRAVKKGSMMYDKLIASGKPAWKRSMSIGGIPARKRLL